ncbi:hypothetical protein JOD43_002211 [Pullulanibacillus pueri]|uniref:YfhD family protein n=1 Tax=Pullulanibacillus pueri TaxID=1437324 RepID=A0A8J2ZZH7_9BACL|nr:YfhD family protein [Pullulanibacillus pueri]MBM7682039.1 hypothetical protein [Pullulanibacillus pueri]GGH88297.1 hypothetical protein GCM10007096_40310 [Pullulanibacillus pueri]
MGNTRGNRDKNTSTLPQTPHYAKRSAGQGDDLEIAQNLDEQYTLQAKPGFQATEVKRKK